VLRRYHQEFTPHVPDTTSQPPSTPTYDGVNSMRRDFLETNRGERGGHHEVRGKGKGKGEGEGKGKAVGGEGKNTPVELFRKLHAIVDIFWG